MKLLYIIILVWSPILAAQTVYISDQISIGLHTDKTLESPIAKVVDSGTPLELVKTEDELSFVREPGGTGGWVDNSYVSNSSSANVLLREAEARISELENTISGLGESQMPAGSSDDERLTRLQQQLQAERGRVTALQEEISSLQEQQQPGTESDSLYSKIEQLSRENNQLKNELAGIIEHTEAAKPLSTAQHSTLSGWLTTRTLSLTAAVLLVLGIVLGVYIMDYFNRKRHGGFRI